MNQIELFTNKVSKFKTKEQELRYYGSDLNKFVDLNCRRDMVVNNIDLITLDYTNKNELRIIESKHSKEKLKKGQEIILKKLSELGVKCYVIYGDEPYDIVEVYSFQRKKSKLLMRDELIKFLNNEL